MIFVCVEWTEIACRCYEHMRNYKSEIWFNCKKRNIETKTTLNQSLLYNAL